MQGICALCILHNALVLYVRDILPLFPLVYVRNICYHVLNNKTQNTTRKAVKNMKLYGTLKSNGNIYILSEDLEKDAQNAEMTVAEYINKTQEYNPQLRIWEV